MQNAQAGKVEINAGCPGVCSGAAELGWTQSVLAARQPWLVVSIPLGM